ncbi:hypothetical protein KUTeg_005556 [Tegillarca granosa]|uniref:Mitochondria-eating protein C-terminal domain-containing protein n=1 Tax=Tegillarca granosa TaxID=220873 RepID=A0ABQ9FNY3_TEGGR|nr:hypothetical protein KUTeg_005556 [Tegillarca granosa]
MILLPDLSRNVLKSQWYMCLQDPPMVLDDSVTELGPFDTSLHKYYNKKGDLYNFIVWPILRLEKDGPLSTLGVAAATTKQLSSRRQTGASKASKI